MNIIQQTEMLKDVSDNRIVKEMRQPSGQFPLYLVSSEAKRRSDLRQRFKAEQAGPPPQTTVQEDLLRAIMSREGQGQGIAQNIGQAPQNALQPQTAALPQMAPQRGMTVLPTQQPMAPLPQPMAPLPQPQDAGIMRGALQPQQGFAGGGMIRGFANQPLVVQANPRLPPLGQWGVTQVGQARRNAIIRANRRAGREDLDNLVGAKLAPIYGEDPSARVVSPIEEHVYGSSASIPRLAIGYTDDPSITKAELSPPLPLSPEDIAATRHAKLSQDIIDDYGKMPKYDPYTATSIPEQDVISDEARLAANYDPTAVTARMKKYGGKALDLEDLTDPNKLYADQLAVLKGQPDPYAAHARRLDKREARIAEDAESNPWLSLAKAGFSIAGGTSPYAMENIGKGSKVGIDAYVEGKKEITSREESADAARLALTGVQEERKAALRDQADKFANRQMTAEKYANNIKKIEDTAARETHKINNAVAQHTAILQSTGEVQRSASAVRALATKQAIETRRAEGDWRKDVLGQKEHQAGQIAARADHLAKIKGKERLIDHGYKAIEAEKVRAFRLELQELTNNATTNDVKNAKAYLEGSPELQAAMIKLSGTNAATAKLKSANISRSWLGAMKAFNGDQGGVEAPTAPKDIAQVRGLFVTNLIAYMGRDEANLYADAMMLRMGVATGAGGGSGTTSTADGVKTWRKKP